MSRVSFTVRTPLSPAEVLAIVTDFGPARVERWPQLDPDRYRVHEVGATFAEVTEGGAPLPDVWARERYDWSTPGRVRATIVESSVFQSGGTWELEARPAPDGGTAAVVTWDRRPRGVKGLLLTALVLAIGRRALAADLERALAPQPRPATKGRI